MMLPRKGYSEERWREQDAWDQGYTAGLRRAQELAKEMTVEDAAYFDFEDLIDAIDAEAGEGRT